jgi:hypothetical protein
MFFYAASVWAFALALDSGLLKDTYVYAVLVVLVNIGLFYIIKTGTNALDVRAGLNRCFLAAARLRFEAEAGSGLTVPSDKPQRVLPGRPRRGPDRPGRRGVGRDRTGPSRS